MRATSKAFADAIANIPNDLSRRLDYSFAISDKLFDEMKRQRISQRELARRMNKRPSEIAKWLSGSHNFTIKTLAEISLVIGVDLIKV